MLIKTLGDDSALLIMNTGDKEQSFQVSQLKKFLPGKNIMKNIKSDELIDLNSEDSLNLNKFDTGIYLLEK